MGSAADKGGVSLVREPDVEASPGINGLHPTDEAHVLADWSEP